ncbi:NAD(P)-dependent nickel-iron dehydrogenase flavin-containing subunit [Geothermobacter ehrlichii]|uniref:NAD(P)-dependent nickel-iron dehydrogenase flavin-containing subunit n=1 Tax=Geothermobacter ehrlichii TaxID=213224 RepID=A0A5D3WLU4_9BACT|nr:NADH-ubiquinone oxidoreductase-F iron-sulfur binding region domain-containing protein [Geothermobacter ehrlichii]TYO99244.1 NAD(P)-dependent nickel-iron dehydrogenase flavin-containing subunit [Geothermobacter ehrlichii]
MNPADLAAVAEQERQRQRQLLLRIFLCYSTPCLSAGAQQVRGALEELIRERDLAVRLEIVATGCMGPCSRGPLLRLRRADGDEQIFERVTPELARAILLQALELAPPQVAPLDPDLPFFTRQTRVVLANSGWIDPERLEDSIAHGAYAALAHALHEMTPEEVCAEIKQSGLRGRGGGGYPTGVKWNLVRKAPAERKFVVANGDEGDPGAYMDRTIMESDPHRVLEGMAIAGYAVGAEQGYIYVRGEYPLAASRLAAAIRQAERRGLLGSRILDSNFNFRIDLRIGAGAFVCGEETALMKSIMGRRGQPVPRPPYPAQKGLWGFPTLINNVETYANVGPIISRGAEWFAAMGTGKSRGTKVFALCGEVVNSGLIEVEMGIRLRDIVFEIGGGLPDGGRFKAAQTGGPSGGCIPAQHLDTPVDYESLKELGSIMGSGGLIVMGEGSCMPDVAKFFMDFCMDESCGKCVPCRVGTVEMRRLLGRITDGSATMEDFATLEQLCELVRETSLCGLGMTAPNPVLNTLRYFRDEYLAHIVDRQCPAGVCNLDRIPLLKLPEHAHVLTLFKERTDAGHHPDDQ